MLIAPAAGVLGVLPFIFQLDLTFVQFLLVTFATLVVSYVLGLIFGAPVYLALRQLGYPHTRYLMTYAALLVLTTPFLLDDVYALLSFGPPVLLVAGAFCFFRGPQLESM